MPSGTATDLLRSAALPAGQNDLCASVLALAGDASLILLGEATHGSEEFYRARSAISRRLLRDHGFDAIAVEADWPDALRVQRWLHGQPREHDRSATDALGSFHRFPLWMWRNHAMVALLDWMHALNETRAPQQKVGFFGLDLYSLRSSMQAVIGYLQQVDPEGAREARERYSCFDHLADEPQRYGHAISRGLRRDCEDDVVQQLRAMLDEAGRYLAADGAAGADELFYAQQNARVVRNAEDYYRTLFHGRDESWNVRDTHMADTLMALRDYLGEQRGRPAKLVVWAHNSHIGDARATEMGWQGQLNLGQLVRQRCAGGDSFLLGFTTHAGTVTAATHWDEPAQLKAVRPSLPDSHEHRLHQLGVGSFLLPLRGRQDVADALGPPRPERAIGVIYRPDTERISHYFDADLGRQFDAVLHIDKTHALRPLDRGRMPDHDDVPETFPFGI